MGVVDKQARIVTLAFSAEAQFSRLADDRHFDLTCAERATYVLPDQFPGSPKKLHLGTYREPVVVQLFCPPPRSPTTAKSNTTNAFDPLDTDFT
jgi:hypothetical protein